MRIKYTAANISQKHTSVFMAYYLYSCPSMIRTPGCCGVAA